MSVSADAQWTDHDVLELLFRVRTLGQTLAAVGLAMTASRSAISGHVYRSERTADQVDALRLRDHERFALLDGVLVRGISADALAKTFAKSRGQRVTRQAILYVIWSILHDTAKAGPDLRDPNVQEVAPWPTWWRADARAVAA
jgi:hypothetical protein